MTEHDPAHAPATNPATHPADAAVPDDADRLSRRRMLAIGAVGTAAVVSIRPAFAQTAVSVLNCEIPVPGPAQASQYIAADGSLVPAGTAGAFPGSPMPFKGEDVKRALAGGRSLPGTSFDQNQAYLEYIKKLRAGQTGFTCFASITMPR